AGGKARSPLPHTVLAPDVALPGRDALLDAEAVGRFLAVELRAGRPVPVARCEVVQTNYRFGKHLRLLYRLRIGRRWRWVSASAFPDGAAEEGFRGATQAAARRAGLRAVVRGTHLVCRLLLEKKKRRPRWVVISPLETRGGVSSRSQ